MSLLFRVWILFLHQRGGVREMEKKKKWMSEFIRNYTRVRCLSDFFSPFILRIIDFSFLVLLFFYFLPFVSF